MRDSILIPILLIFLISIVPIVSAFSGNESGYSINLVAQDGFKESSLENIYSINFIINTEHAGFKGLEGNYDIDLTIYGRDLSGRYSENNFELYLVSEQAFVSYSNGITINDPVQEGIVPYANCGQDKLKCENVNSRVQFNGSASYDPDDIIKSYKWEFGDGTNGNGPLPNHTYSIYKWNGSAYQPFIVNLSVTDNSGLTSTTSLNVTIWMAGDANGDAKIDILDASVVGLKWNGNDPCADLNNDGKVNILDASIIGLNWRKTV